MIKKPSKPFAYEHLLVLPVPFRRVENELFLEAQAAQGLRRWLENFESLVVAAPIIPEYIAIQKNEIHWVTPGNLNSRVMFVELPWAYRPDHFIRHLPHTIRILRRLINESHYLQFAIGSFWGDWAGVAAELAIWHDRQFAVHTDRVEHDVIRQVSKIYPFLKRWRATLDSFLMKIWHYRIISRCDLGLFHGMDTYRVYSNWMDVNQQKYCIHNIHDEGLFDLSNSVADFHKHDDYNLRLIYAGRIATEKAPLDWVKALSFIKNLNISFKAVWAGDGILRQVFLHALDENNLVNEVDSPGFISDRSKIGHLFLQSDLFVFTHITPESPRCLLEALRFGVPIVGYESEFARDLIHKHGGGILVPVGNWKALGEAIANLANNPENLAELKKQAFNDGARFTSKAVFEERSNLIKTHLS